MQRWTETVLVRLPAGVKARIRKLAEPIGKTETSWVRETILRALQSEEARKEPRAGASG